MAESLTISILCPLEFTASDRAQLEVNGTLQQDRIRLWGAERDRLGFGKDAFGTGAFGLGSGLGFGLGVFGLGPFGHDVRLITYETRAAFVAGDYMLRIRGVDALGNAGEWSSTVLHPHRPKPPAPRNSAITPGTSVQTWSWSDP